MLYTNGYEYLYSNSLDKINSIGFFIISPCKYNRKCEIQRINPLKYKNYVEKIESGEYKKVEEISEVIKNVLIDTVNKKETDSFNCYDDILNFGEERVYIKYKLKKLKDIVKILEKSNLKILNKNILKEDNFAIERKIKYCNFIFICQYNDDMFDNELIEIGIHTRPYETSEFYYYFTGDIHNYFPKQSFITEIEVLYGKTLEKDKEQENDFKERKIQAVQDNTKMQEQVANTIMSVFTYLSQLKVSN